MDLILQVSWINLILFIWFDTNTFVEYAKLFKLKRFFKINLFEEYKLINPKITYHHYIRQKHPSFITKLMTCQPCFCFWIVMIFCAIYNNIILFPIIYLCSYIIYKILKRYVYYI